jgi:hypothetical protein
VPFGASANAMMGVIAYAAVQQCAGKLTHGRARSILPLTHTQNLSLSYMLKTHLLSHIYKTHNHITLVLTHTER